jgi:Patatin-like phospholipase
MTSDRTFELGLVMAGAISAGAYTAGVMDFLFEALDAYYEEKRKPGWDGPTHDVRIPIMSGASAGGMTSAICALHAFHDLAHVWPGKPIPPPEQNRLYSSWVTDISLDRLLETSDLDAPGIRGLKSVLCCDVLEQIVGEAFKMSAACDRAWIGRGDDPSLRVRLTLTNLRGAPYSFRLFGSDTDETYGMLNHGDYFDFAVGKASGLAPGAEPGATPLNVMDLGEKGWDIYRETALATGAFPVGLAPRIIERPNTSFYGEAQSFGYEDPSTGEYYPVKPDASFDDIAPYGFVSVDGGVIDNAPLELARRYLSGGAAIHNERNGDGANKAVLLIAPFPNFAAAPPKDDNDLLVHMLQQLLSALIDQARFKPEELQLAANDTCFSRFMISPTRQGNGSAIAKQFPIASGVLSGFGGFLDESFRQHDYLLGRRNAQAFLRWNFALPETNARLFEGVAINGDRWHVRNADNQTATLTAADENRLEKKKFAETEGGAKTTFGFPIIPLVERLLTPIEIPAADMPKPDEVDRAALSARIDARAKKVIATLIDVDLRRVMHDLGLYSDWFAHVAMFGADRVGGPFLADVLAKKAETIIDQALDQVKQAFAPKVAGAPRP